MKCKDAQAIISNLELLLVLKEHIYAYLILYGILLEKLYCNFLLCFLKGDVTFVFSQRRCNMVDAARLIEWHFLIL